jgi:Arc/MetJ-type ribon-helix-helix transcriptional regulator
MLKRTIRMTPEADQRLQSEAKLRGYANASAFVRAAIENELRGREDTMAGTEQRLAANMEELRNEIRRSGRAQQALFAYMDALAKIFLTCVPEPVGEAMEAALVRARGRHMRLLKNAGQAMAGESKLAFRELVNRGEG